jgi:hypothetical protein
VGEVKPSVTATIAVPVATIALPVATIRVPVATIPVAVVAPAPAVPVAAPAVAVAAPAVAVATITIAIAIAAVRIGTQVTEAGSITAIPIAGVVTGIAGGGRLAASSPLSRFLAAERSSPTLASALVSAITLAHRSHPFRTLDCPWHSQSRRGEAPAVRVRSCAMIRRRNRTRGASLPDSHAARVGQSAGRADRGATE